MNLTGVLFFPITPFQSSGHVDTGLLTDHIEARLTHRPGAVFAACGTGEFHALSAGEVGEVVTTAVGSAAADASGIPVFSGAGGPLGHAIECARRAADAGARGLLLMPHYLVGSTQAGIKAYVESVAEAADLPIVLYNRGATVYTPATVAELAADPRVIGFKDGVGDIGRVREVVSAVASVDAEFLFFNGLLTAEVTQAAYQAIGVPLYSSAAFAMLPEVATAFHAAYTAGDEGRCAELLSAFYLPLVRLRDEVPGFGVSLIKAGVRLSGSAVGGVRAPLVDPDPVQEAELERILRAGRELIAAR